jgi:hypothetical protein
MSFNPDSDSDDETALNAALQTAEAAEAKKLEEQKRAIKETKEKFNALIKKIKETNDAISTSENEIKKLRGTKSTDAADIEEVMLSEEIKKINDEKLEKERAVSQAKLAYEKVKTETTPKSEVEKQAVQTLAEANLALNSVAKTLEALQQKGKIETEKRAKERGKDKEGSLRDLESSAKALKISLESFTTEALSLQKLYREQRDLLKDIAVPEIIAEESPTVKTLAKLKQEESNLADEIKKLEEEFSEQEEEVRKSPGGEGYIDVFFDIEDIEEIKTLRQLKKSIDYEVQKRNLEVVREMAAQVVSLQEKIESKEEKLKELNMDVKGLSAIINPNIKQTKLPSPRKMLQTITERNKTFEEAQKLYNSVNKTIDTANRQIAEFEKNKLDSLKEQLRKLEEEYERQQAAHKADVFAESIKEQLRELELEEEYEHQQAAHKADVFAESISPIKPPEIYILEAMIKARENILFKMRLEMEVMQGELKKIEEKYNIKEKSPLTLQTPRKPKASSLEESIVLENLTKTSAIQAANDAWADLATLDATEKLNQRILKDLEVDERRLLTHVKALKEQLTDHEDNIDDKMLLLEENGVDVERLDERISTMLESVESQIKYVDEEFGGTSKSFRDQVEMSRKEADKRMRVAAEQYKNATKMMKKVKKLFDLQGQTKELQQQIADSKNPNPIEKKLKVEPEMETDKKDKIKALKSKEYIEVEKQMALAAIELWISEMELHAIKLRQFRIEKTELNLAKAQKPLAQEKAEKLQKVAREEILQSAKTLEQETIKQLKNTTKDITGEMQTLQQRLQSLKSNEEASMNVESNVKEATLSIEASITPDENTDALERLRNKIIEQNDLAAEIEMMQHQEELIKEKMIKLTESGTSLAQGETGEKLIEAAIEAEKIYASKKEAAEERASLEKQIQVLQAESELRPEEKYKKVLDTYNNKIKDAFKAEENLLAITKRYEPTIADSTKKLEDLKKKIDLEKKLLEASKGSDALEGIAEALIRGSNKLKETKDKAIEALQVRGVREFFAKFQDSFYENMHSMPAGKEKDDKIKLMKALVAAQPSKTLHIKTISTEEKQKAVSELKTALEAAFTAVEMFYTAQAVGVQAGQGLKSGADKLDSLENEFAILQKEKLTAEAEIEKAQVAFKAAQTEQERAKDNEHKAREAMKEEESRKEKMQQEYEVKQLIADFNKKIDDWKEKLDKSIRKLVPLEEKATKKGKKLDEKTSKKLNAYREARAVLDVPISTDNIKERMQEIEKIPKNLETVRSIGIWKNVKAGLQGKKAHSTSQFLYARKLHHALHDQLEGTMKKNKHSEAEPLAPTKPSKLPPKS